MTSPGVSDDATVPLLPVLSRGRHRGPRYGGCFMEIASYLAGERWSDHPRCTHPLLAALARAVNDGTSDAARPALAPMIPSVVGLVGEDVVIDARLALLCATTALPVAAEPRQQLMAVAALTSARLLRDLGADADGRADRQAQTALAQVPHAAAWARSLPGEGVTGVRQFQERLAPVVVDRAVDGIVHAATCDRDGLLCALLAAGIDRVAAHLPGARDRVAVDDERWSSVVRLTERARWRPMATAKR